MFHNDLYRSVSACGLFPLEISCTANKMILQLPSCFSEHSNPLTTQKPILQFNIPCPKQKSKPKFQGSYIPSLGSRARNLLLGQLFLISPLLRTLYRLTEYRVGLRSYKKKKKKAQN
jgi:hypothetical protein